MPSRTASAHADPAHPTRDSVKRVLLKLSGESFSQPGRSGIDPHELHLIASEIAEARQTGAEIAIVVGGGNFVRGADLAERGTSPARPRTTWACSAPSSTPWP